MTTVPAWTAHHWSIFSSWGPRGEQPAELAERAAPFLREWADALGSDGWRADSREHVIQDDELEARIRSKVFVDDVGKVILSDGYWFSLWARVGDQYAGARFRIGRSNPGRRIMSNEIQFHSPSGLPADPVAMVRSVIEHWDPLSARSQEADTTRAFGYHPRRRRWTPGIGRRTWLSPELGEVTHAPPGIVVEPFAGGTLLSADDSWTPEQVAEAGISTLELNDVGGLPLSRIEPPRTAKNPGVTGESHSGVLSTPPGT